MQAASARALRAGTLASLIFARSSRRRTSSSRKLRLIVSLSSQKPRDIHCHGRKFGP
jgi:chromosome segregation ATPase